MLRPLAFADAQQHGETQLAQGTAAFHPVGGIDHLHLGVVIAALQAGDHSADFGGMQQLGDGFALVVAQRPEAAAQGDDRFHIVDALFGEVLPAPMRGQPQHARDGGELVAAGNAGGGRQRPAKRRLVALHEMLQHVRCDHARQVAAACRGGHGQAQANEVMHGVADHGLVEVANFDLDLAFGTGNRTEVAIVAVAADPDRRSLRQGFTPPPFQPLIELDGAAAHIAMRAFRHFAALL